MEEYCGKDINKGARLCGMAGPDGIVINANDFPELPEFPADSAMFFSRETCTLKGISGIHDVWITGVNAVQKNRKNSL